MVSSDAVIDDDLLRQVIDVGHSRVPVYEGNRQVGGSMPMVCMLGACSATVGWGYALFNFQVRILIGLQCTLGAYFAMMGGGHA